MDSMLIEEDKEQLARMKKIQNFLSKVYIRLIKICCLSFLQISVKRNVEFSAS